ncbi:GNAT family N-acetyltransferase [Actinomycetes bacterium KLBMP 9797]
MLRPDYPVTTARLLLRPFTPADVDEVWAYQRQPEVARYMPWAPRSRERSEAAVHQMVNENGLGQEGDCLSLAVIWPEAGVDGGAGAGIGRLVGQIELVWHSEQSRQGELGYVFNPAYQGKGLATEAARALLRWGFEEFDLHRIVGRCDARNTASAGVLERLGMRREAHHIDSALREGAWRSEYVYAILEHEWRGGTHP